MAPPSVASSSKESSAATNKRTDSGLSRSGSESEIDESLQEKDNGTPHISNSKSSITQNVNSSITKACSNWINKETTSELMVDHSPSAQAKLENENEIFAAHIAAAVINSKDSTDSIVSRAPTAYLKQLVNFNPPTPPQGNKSMASIKESAAAPVAPTNVVTPSKNSPSKRSVESPPQAAAASPTKSKPESSAASPSSPSTNNSNATTPTAAAARKKKKPTDKIRLGICAMDKKARSKPMAEILSRLDDSLFEIVFFGDKLIQNAPVDTWPIVDVLIAFYSSGYPLDKAIAYAELRKPFVLNDLNMQHTLKDRRKVYDLLEEAGIDVPPHVYMSRDNYISTGTGAGTKPNENELVEHDDHIELNGVVMHKPFVEKPIDADDHNIAIYYPTSAGGGCKKLFRKIGDRSSEFYPDINEVRRDGSFIYEEFVETQGTDVKMYTVGPDYGHAEARKSPTVDGKVERNSDGKEIRFPVILTLREKEIARRIVLVFKQLVCGFDLLRVQEGDSLVSYVCDVNGWSFVKNSQKYYDDCAQILSEHMLAAVNPKELRGFSAIDPLLASMEEEKQENKNNSDISSTAHKLSGNRKSAKETLIQRASRMLQMDPTNIVASSMDNPMDDNATHNNGADFLPTCATPSSDLDMSLPVREIPDKLAQEPASMGTSTTNSIADETDLAMPFGTTGNISNNSTKGEKGAKSNSSSSGTGTQMELRCVIAIIRHGDRTPKQKLKVDMTEPHILQYFQEHSDNPRKDLKVKAKKPMKEFLETVKLMISEKELEQKSATRASLRGEEEKEAGEKQREIITKLKIMRDVLQRWKIGGLNRKLQIKPRAWEEVEDEDGNTSFECTEAQVILKWGGNLTKLGERQAINLGQRLRHEMYPNSPGGGILRLHSTFRHDLKIKTSDEGRVMKTAAAFAKGMLELEGEIPPILVSLVHKEKDSLHMLDPSGNKEVKNELEECKVRINENLQKNFDFDETTVLDHEQIVGPSSMVSMHKALKEVGNPRETLFEIREVIGELLEKLDDMLGLITSGDENKIEGGEGLKGESELDEALSGIKLYKGETLLELTERWRLLYYKLYDEEKDEFDLSRVPDVHDNVRFDMLHNPHLGLSRTLGKLYKSAKLMADCVVPQEYGTTIEEKKSIGSKMCRTLLEKIKYDLIIARTDNQVDMRYMINMDYSDDHHINTHWRRIRTRLYFTSESHLHTLLNVLRFGDAHGCILSQKGKDKINLSPELCYLTQVVIRLFEDNKKEVTDPKRFRIEILFSPGATATPLHISENDRDLESTRVDTEPLYSIGLDDLTCKQVEDFFTRVIDEGKTEDDDDVTVKSIAESSKKGKAKKKKSKLKGITVSASPKKKMESSSYAAERAGSEKNVQNSVADSSDGNANKSEFSANAENLDAEQKQNKENIVTRTSRTLLFSDAGESAEGDESADKNNENDHDGTEKVSSVLARKYIWTSLAAVSFILGVGCFILSRNVRDNFNSQRRWTKRT